MVVTVSKKIGFDAAHYLPNYLGKCKNLHGHHWIVEVGCAGPVVEATGMVVDFVEMKDFLRWVEEKFDHRLINDTIPNPTAENICKYIYDEFNLWCIARGLTCRFIKVWETEDSYALLSC